MSFVFVIWHKYQKYQSVELGDQLISRLLDCFFPGRLYILRAVNGFAAPRQLAGARLSRVQLGTRYQLWSTSTEPSLSQDYRGQTKICSRIYNLTKVHQHLFKILPLLMPEQTLKLAVPLTAGCLTFQVTIIISRKRTSPIEVES